MRLCPVTGTILSGAERMQRPKYRIEPEDMEQIREITGVIEALSGSLKTFKVKHAAWSALIWQLHCIIPKKVRGAITESHYEISEIVDGFFDRSWAVTLQMLQKLVMVLMLEFPVKRKSGRKTMKRLGKWLREREIMRPAERHQALRLLQAPDQEYQRELFDVQE